MSDKLPDNLVQLDVIRINRNIDKACKCDRWDRKFTLDTTNKKVYCNCGAEVEPYEALYDLTKYYENLQEQTQKLLEQRKEIVNYKPWLLVFRSLEEQYRGKKMVPCCPECGHGFFFEDIRSWTSRELEIKRREKSKE